MKLSKLVQWAAISLSASLLIGCNSSSSSSSAPKTQNLAVVNTISAGFTDARLAFIDLENENLGIDGLANSTGKSGYTLLAHNEHFYHIGQNNIDIINKYSMDDPTKRIWQYRAKDTAESPSTNPHDLVFLNDQVAFLLLYASEKIWVVNPSAKQEKDFKISEIDISDYTRVGECPDNSNCPPRAEHGAIIGDKLFVALQRNGTSASAFGLEDVNSYVAVFDISDLNNIKEIDTNKGENGLKGIKLHSVNPQKITYSDALDKLVVTSLNLGSSATPLIGGIETINPTTFDNEYLIDDVDFGDKIYDSIIIDQSLAYLVRYNGFGNNDICKFDPTSGNIINSIDCDAASLKNIGVGAGGINLDDNNNLWISINDSADPRIVILDTSDNTVIHTIQTDMNPNQVVFLPTAH